jgi:lipopolysaccharide export system permease protein
MTIGGIFKLSSLIANGVDWKPLVIILAISIPQVLSFSIPVSILISVLLVFGRLSSDSEIVAMQSCGISLFRVALPIWICGLILSGTCFMIYNRIVPITHYKTRATVSQLKHTSIDKLIEVGRFIDITPQLSVFVGKRNNLNLADIRIYDTSLGFRREIIAKHGNLTNNTASGKIVLKLHDVRINPFKNGSPGAAYCSVLPIEVDAQNKKSKYRQKVTDFTGMQLLRRIRNIKHYFPKLSPQETAEKRSKFMVELNSRAAMSISCLVFAIIGIPLGIKSHRKETSIGIAIGLGLITFFYMFMNIAHSLAKYPQTIPHLIVWIPVVVSCLLGLLLMRLKK